MIELPNGKVCRNLPEQVAENVRNIEELYKIFNESGVAPFIITLGASSGTLTDAEFEIAENKLAIIVYDGVQYYKSGINADSTKYIFRSVRYYAEEVSGDIDYYKINNDIFEITIASKTFAKNTQSLGNFYLKEEIDANFAKSGTSYEVPASSITIAAATGLTITKGYCKLEVINNVMYLVAQFSLKNDTASSISVANTCSLTFPVSDTEIAGKVFDVANHDLNYDSGDSNLTGILGTRYAHDSGIAGGGFSGGGNLNVCRRNNTAKQILAVLRDGPTIAANATYWFSFRTFLTLI